MEDTKKMEEKPVLLGELLRLVEKCQGVYGQRCVYNRVLGLVMAEFFAFGRHTITQLLLMLGITEEDWSGWYRLFSAGRFDEEATSAVLVNGFSRAIPLRCLSAFTAKAVPCEGKRRARKWERAWPC